MKNVRILWPVIGTAFVLVLSLHGCASGVTGSTMAEIAGEHQATRIELTGEGGDTQNLISDGARLHLTLHQDGSASGTWSVPPGVLPSGEAEERELSGSWSLDGEIVRFQFADTFFLETIDFRVRFLEGGFFGMDGEGTLEGRTVFVVLT